MKERFQYDDKIVRHFVLATLIWGLVAFLLGVLVALQLVDFRFNLDLSWFSFGRLRPLHTNAAIFAFGCNAIFAGIYYSMQRLLKTRMYSDVLSRIHFWAWQLCIVGAAVSLPLGFTVGKEYAELEMPLAWAVNLVWVVFAVNFFGTLARRREKHLYVAIWFYIATVITVALLHVVNTINVPVSFLKSYPLYAGVQDALVQWWYGHNAVAFVLTTPFLGLMYYFLPKAAERPVYSYRLSIVHFWSLIFIYIWAGPHHLLYTALPDWAQTLGMIFSVMLWAPSWGGMINGLLTLKGEFAKVRSEPILKFFVAALTFYGMATFEGPLLSIKSVSALGHYTDWIIGHVHGGTLGWNGFMTFAMVYWLVPKLWKTPIYSKSLANAHFWLGLTGTVLYMVSMWVSGITQGAMLLSIDAAGKLAYPDFVQTVLKILPLYWIRALGGSLFTLGFILMLFNVFKTIALGKRNKANLEDETAEAFALSNHDGEKKAADQNSHRRLEGLGLVFSVFTFLAVMAGSFIELFPTFFTEEFVSSESNVRPYSALQLAGRDIYVREGCYTCHSQMVRPMVAETLRYGAYSRAEESKYDHPFQWGSKRTGPDLARVSGKYPDLWHFRHLLDPRVVVPGSIMPAYPWLFKDKTDFRMLPRKFRSLKWIGVPYSEDEIRLAKESAQSEAQQIAAGLVKEGAPENIADKEIVALISYLQRLGLDFREGRVK